MTMPYAGDAPETPCRYPDSGDVTESLKLDDPRMQMIVFHEDAHDFNNAGYCRKCGLSLVTGGSRMSGCKRYAVLSLVMLVASVVLAGCSITVPVIPPIVVPPIVTPTNAPPVVVTNTPPVVTPTNTPMNYTFIPGNQTLDGGAESWKQFPGFDVRLSVNDSSKIPGCANGWYTLDGGIVQDAGGLTYQQNSDGTYTFTATDFVSPKSGLHYKHFGYTIQHSANPLVTGDVLVLQKSDQQNTLRILWATVTP